VHIGAPASSIEPPSAGEPADEAELTETRLLRRHAASNTDLRASKLPGCDEGSVHVAGIGEVPGRAHKIIAQS
jgi:hypothetical protein